MGNSLVLQNSNPCLHTKFWQLFLGNTVTLTLTFMYIFFSLRLIKEHGVPFLRKL